MSKAEQQAATAAATTESATSTTPQLDEIVKLMPTSVERDRASELVDNLVRAAMQGQVTFDKNVVKTITQAIAKIDAVMSKQLAAVMHSPSFQKLEGTWRGLNYLVMNSETSKFLKLRVLNCPRQDLKKDLENAIEFDQSAIWKKIHEQEFDMPGGEPYGALIGDYEFTNHPDDINILKWMSNVAAGSFCPFISAASPQLFGFESFTGLPKPRDLEKIFQKKEYIGWRSFRDSEDSRFVALTMPRVLSRLPYGSNTKPIEEFNYEEVELEGNKAKKVPHEHYAWMNSAYALGARLTDAFAQWGWCTAIRGFENGGKLEGLPAHVFKTDDGDDEVKCPTEIGIPDRRDAELSKLGFIPACYYKNTDYAVFFSGQTTQQPKKYGPRDQDATANAALSARLPYLMAASRIAHYLKVIARDKIGAFMEAEDCQRWLERWIADYVSTDPNPGKEQKAKYPLAEAKIEVTADPENPGAYRAVAWLRPWLQLEELTTSLRLVARLPKGKS